MKKIMLSVLVILQLASCSNHLSNSKAKEQISTTFNLPVEEMKEIEYKNYWVGWKIIYAELSPFVQNGLLYSDHYGSGLYSYLLTEPTEKAKDFIVEDGSNNFKIKLCDLEFDEIISILEYPELNLAEVQYTLRRTNLTPFGELSNPSLDPIITKMAKFQKYNDGWKISQ